jgi:hypothetical protein
MELLEDPEKIRKASWEKGIYVNIIPLKPGKLVDVRLEVNVRGDIIKGKETFSQRDPKTLYDKVDEVYLWAYRNY